MTSNFKRNDTDLYIKYDRTNKIALPFNHYTIGGTVELDDNFSLYMFGTRSLTGFSESGTDLGFYFQVDAPTYANDLGAYNVANPWGGAQGAKFQYARWIWNEAGAIASAVANSYMWYYYTFYYTGAANTGTVYGICDNYAGFYLNGAYVGSMDGGWGTGSNGNSFSISIVNGMNYIRIAAYNGGGPAGLIVALYNSAGTNIVNTNGNWAVATSTTYNDASTAKTFNATAT
jgi:hypothetical protein